jgi:alkylhydroperoxidase family enzyme
MWGKLPALDECGRAAKLAAMTFIETVPADDATGDVAAMYDADRELRGFLPNYTQAFSHRPGVYAAWRQLVGAITQNMDPRRYELVSVAAGRALRSTYCTAAHSIVLAEKWPDERPDDVDFAVMDLAKKVAGDAASVEQGDIDRLRGLGLTDAEVFDVVAAAALRSFFAKTLDGLGAQADAQFGQRLDDSERDKVTVGRPFASVGE